MADRAAMSDESSGVGPRGALARRWPTLLALAVSAPGFFDQPNAEEVHALAQAMLLLPLWYVVVGAVARRGWTWFVVVGVTGLFVLLRMQERVEPVLVLLAISLTGVLWGSVRGRLAHPSFLLQIAGLVVFAALAVAGLASAPDLGRYLVAAGWFAHGLWDIAHYRADAGVARTGAEWCAVVDIVIAAQLVLLPLLI